MNIKQQHAEILRQYLNTTGTTQDEFATMIKVSQGNVGHWLAARQRISPEQAKRIEEATQGAIKRQDLYQELFT